MSLIEGIGDEVTVFFAIAAVIVIVVCAWLSTHTRDIPFFSVLIVELTGRRNRETPQSSNSESEETTTESSVSADSETTEGQEEHPQQNDKESNETNQGQSHHDSNSSLPTATSSSGSQNETQRSESCQSQTQLRQRPLEFLSKADSSVSHNESSESGSTDSAQERNERTSPSDNQGTVLDELDVNDGNIRIKLKYLNETHRLVQTSPLETIGQFKRTHFGPELAANKLVRLIFNGQCLQNDTSTLQSYNIQDNCTVHCLVTDAQRQTPTQPAETRNDMDLGMFMFPMFGLLLATIWYFRFAYRQYFNAMSTFSLFGITFLYSVAFFSAWRSRHGQEEHQHLE